MPTGVTRSELAGIWSVMIMYFVEKLPEAVGRVCGELSSAARRSTLTFCRTDQFRSCTAVHRCLSTRSLRCPVIAFAAFGLQVSTNVVVDLYWYFCSANGAGRQCAIFFLVESCFVSPAYWLASVAHPPAVTSAGVVAVEGVDHGFQLFANCWCTLSPGFIESVPHLWI